MSIYFIANRLFVSSGHAFIPVANKCRTLRVVSVVASALAGHRNLVH
jgi:hypothetical protein